MSKEAQIVVEDGIEYVFQPIVFEPEIMSEYYVGNEFVGVSSKSGFGQDELSGLMQKAGMDGFMPELVKEITNDVIGENNQIFEGYDFGREEGKRIDEVNFYFLIKKEKYEEVCPK